MSTQIPDGSLKKCDIVMKGGITSGIVYPGLICKLAERYQFKSIGGTSAGAIAAALTAAAEYARRQGRDAFGDIAQVPGWLGAPSKFAAGSNLLNLFQPQRQLRVPFRLATAFLVQGWLRLLAQAENSLKIVRRKVRGSGEFADLRAGEFHVGTDGDNVSGTMTLQVDTQRWPGCLSPR